MVQPEIDDTERIQKSSPSISLNKNSEGEEDYPERIFVREKKNKRRTVGDHIIERSSEGYRVAKTVDCYPYNNNHFKIFEWLFS